MTLEERYALLKILIFRGEPAYVVIDRLRDWQEEDSVREVSSDERIEERKTDAVES